jgi:hypothetical protein
MLVKLLKKPKRTREQYAFWGAVSTTGVVGLVWFMALSINFQDGGPFAVDESQQTASAFSQFFNELKSDFLKTQSTEDNESKNEGEGEEVNTATSSSPGETKEVASSSPAFVATSSPRVIQVGTSSSQKTSD